jgi:uncharacterized membrane protein (UPF0127 family)
MATARKTATEQAVEHVNTGSAEAHRRAMRDQARKGYAFNRTRQTFLATDMRVADSHWTRFRGLMAVQAERFGFGQALWIIPCHGVHTWAMRFAIDVLYLDTEHKVVHMEENLRPWSFAPVRMDAATVLELPSHTIWNSGTKVGDLIELNVTDKNTKVVAA